MSGDTRALITGITGQDGRHLAELLHAKGYEVFGLIRGQRNARREAFEAEFPFVHLVEADLTDPTSLIAAVRASEADEVYNLGAISHVGYSFRNPQLTADVTAQGRAQPARGGPDRPGAPRTVRFYQASTSEMFGGLDYNRPGRGLQRGLAVPPAQPLRRREALRRTGSRRTTARATACSSRCGILFNHEGERRGLEFVTRKITDAVARIHLGLQPTTSSSATCGPSATGATPATTCAGMWQMLQHDEPDDFVLATGETHSIEEFLTLAFAEIGIDDWRPYVRAEPRVHAPGRGRHPARRPDQGRDGCSAGSARSTSTASSAGWSSTT